MSSEGGNEAIDGSLEYEDDEIIDSLNTVPEPQHGPMPQANHIDDGVLYEGKVFNNDNEAYNFYCLFA